MLKMREGTHGKRRRQATAEARILSAIKEAISLDEAGQTVLAIRLLTPLLREFPAEPGILIYLAWCLRLGRHFEEAIEHARLAVQLLAKSEQASLVLFHALWDAGNKDDGIDEIRRFLAVRRSEQKAPHYVDILKKWGVGDRDAVSRAV
jgi:hypothetical protein